MQDHKAQIARIAARMVEEREVRGSQVAEAFVKAAREAAIQQREPMGGKLAASFK